MKKLKKERLLELSFPVINQSLHADLPVNIFVADYAGHLVWVNTRMLKAIKETQKSYFGKHLSTWGEEKWDACQRVIESRCEEGLEEEGPDNRYYFTNRKPIWRRDRSSIVGIIGVSLDITAQKQAERTKKAFIMNMAHDIRIPFCGIVGFAQLQEQGILKTFDEVREYGRIIHESGNQLLEILNAVIVALDKNDIGDIKKNKLDLYAFAQELQALIKPNIVLNDLEFELKVDNDIGEMVTDKIRLKQILANLLSNALKFTPQGKITLSFAWAYLNNKKEKLIIKVSDTGIGIDKSHHERIFDKFEKIKPSYESSTFTGCGIGLYLVKKLLKDLKGTISLESELGKGSTFQVEIPLLSG